MVQTGISWVRIGEFAWSRMEPQPGVFEFDWLDRAIDVLASAGLNIILGTPTCTPPRWMVDRYPDMIALDVDGKPRGFGARRHYCFSHEAYRTESVRIAEILGDRYGRTSVSRHGKSIMNTVVTTQPCPTRTPRDAPFKSGWRIAMARSTR